MITNGGMTIAEDAFIGQTLKLGANNAETITLAGGTGAITTTGTLMFLVSLLTGVINSATIDH